MTEITEQPALEILINGQKTVVRLDSFNGQDVKLCRGETGHAPRYWFEHTDEIDIDIMAALVWLTRRKLKPGLTCDAVLESINYGNVSVPESGSEDEEDPES